MKIIYPSQTNAVDGEGLFIGNPTNNLKEYQLSQWMYERGLCTRAEFVIYGFDITIVGGVCGVYIEQGYGIINGYHYENTLQEYGEVPSSTGGYYVFHTMSFNGSIAEDFAITVSASATLPANSVCLGTVTVTTGAITAHTEAVKIPSISTGSVLAAGSVFLGFQPRQVLVIQTSDGLPFWETPTTFGFSSAHTGTYTAWA